MSKRTVLILVLGLLLAGLFVLAQVLLIVRQGDVAVRSTFGKLDDHPITRAGLYFRWPWPVQRVYRFDGRVQVLEGAFEQTLTRDGKNVIATLYAGWRIADPLTFLVRVGTAAQAEKDLNGLLSNYKNAVLGQYDFSALVNVDPKALKFDQVERDILDQARPEARERYGIDLAFVGLRKLSLPEAITEKVFDRMRAERAQVAEQYRAEGNAESIRIRGDADSQRTQVLGDAEAQARRIRAEGDAQAAEYYKVFARDPDLAIFLRKLEVLRSALGEKSTLVLSSETSPFDLLQGDEALPKTPAPEKKP